MPAARGDDKMRSRLRSIVFASILCVVCSLLLTAASTGLRERQAKNAEADRQRNILVAFGIVGEERIPTDKILSLYAENVRPMWADDRGQLLQEDERGPRDMPLFAYVRQDGIQSYAVPIDSRGLWGAIRGYMAFENDGSTIRGFTVYQHQETPGLGAEIDSPAFRQRFEGQKIVDPNGNFVSIQITKAGMLGAIPVERRDNYVDGISGATMTGRYLSEGIRDSLERYEPVAEQFRSDGGQV
jgi:Na+-transporting NADH:ubiquinone oxidoreductase subunit C